MFEKLATIDYQLCMSFKKVNNIGLKQSMSERNCTQPVVYVIQKSEQ